MYKFETHLHTSACSGCAVSSGEEMLKAAAEHGYSGIVITNHFYHGNTCIDRRLDWRDFVGFYAEDYYRSAKYGEKLGITVLFGLEEVYMPGKEMLIYGLTPEAVANCPEFKDMSLREMSDFIHANGGIAVCAHPFRNRSYIPSPDLPPDTSLFDGIEGFNLFNGAEENLKAFVLSRNSGLRVSSGSDVHNCRDFGNAGIDFEEPIKSSSDFVSAFKSGKYRLITPFCRENGDGN